MIFTAKRWFQEADNTALSAAGFPIYQHAKNLNKPMKNDPSISVIIPSFNRREDVLEALKSIYNQDYQDFEVFVVDDNSSDGSVGAIEKHFPNTHVIALHKNKGPAIARNIGIKEARGNIIVGIDSDVIFSNNQILTQIASKFEDSTELHCMSLRLVNYYSQKDDTKTWWHPMPIGEYADKEFYTDYFSGSGYAFRKVVFEKAGYFPEDIFMHGEEVDLAFRILDQGFDIVYCPSITLLHKVSKDARNTMIPFYYHRRNQLWIVAKYYPPLKGFLHMAPRLVKTFFQALFRGHLLTYCKALYDAIRELPVMLRHRKPLSKNTWTKIKLIRTNRFITGSERRDCGDNGYHLNAHPRIHPDIWCRKLRLLFRWSHFSLRSCTAGYWDFSTNAIRAIIRLIHLSVKDAIIRSNMAECNICGWQGAKFYPNVGSGYYELETVCPRCLCQDRHRSLVVVLLKYTDAFEPNTMVIEAAPMRSFQQYCLQLKGNKNYLSFDIERFAMERGDITQMRFSDESAEYFLCSHVLEHIAEDGKALDEIHRVLCPGGYAVLQVPLDWKTEKTLEYPAPDPRETGHVRRYGKDFISKISTHGFKVTCVFVADYIQQDQIRHYGLSTEPIILAKKERNHN